MATYKFFAEKTHIVRIIRRKIAADMSSIEFHEHQITQPVNTNAFERQLVSSTARVHEKFTVYEAIITYVY